MAALFQDFPILQDCNAVCIPDGRQPVGNYHSCAEGLDSVQGSLQAEQASSFTFYTLQNLKYSMRGLAASTIILKVMTGYDSSCQRKALKTSCVHPDVSLKVLISNKPQMAAASASLLVNHC